jgi:hypothetical protein
LYKYNASGKLQSTLNYNYQGNISHIDPSNPLEIYVYYRELNKLLFLDNNLAFRGEADLALLGTSQASAVARSYDNGIWVFDLGDLQLKKFAKDGEGLQQSGNVRQYITGKTGNPDFIYDNGTRVFVNDTLNGILLFDVMCNYIRTIPLKGCIKPMVLDDNIYFLKGGGLFRYNISNFHQSVVNLPLSKGIRDISIEKNMLYLLRDDDLLIYRF